MSGGVLSTSDLAEEVAAARSGRPGAAARIGAHIYALRAAMIDATDALRGIEELDSRAWTLADARALARIALDRIAEREREGGQ